MKKKIKVIKHSHILPLHRNGTVVSLSFPHLHKVKSINGRMPENNSWHSHTNPSKYNGLYIFDAAHRKTKLQENTTTTKVKSSSNHIPYSTVNNFNDESLEHTKAFSNPYNSNTEEPTVAWNRRHGNASPKHLKNPEQYAQKSTQRPKYQQPSHNFNNISGSNFNQHQSKNFNNYRQSNFKKFSNQKTQKYSSATNNSNQVFNYKLRNLSIDNINQQLVTALLKFDLRADKYEIAKTMLNNIPKLNGILPTIDRYGEFDFSHNIPNSFKNLGITLVKVVSGKRYNDTLINGIQLIFELDGQRLVKFIDIEQPF